MQKNSKSSKSEKSEKSEIFENSKNQKMQKTQKSRFSEKKFEIGFFHFLQKSQKSIFSYGFNLGIQKSPISEKTRFLRSELPVKFLKIPAKKFTKWKK